MSSIEQCGIILQHDIDEQYQYEPGEIVRGHVSLGLSKTTPIRSINVKVYGEGNVSWRNEDDEPIQAQEIYVDSTKDIIDTTGHEPLNLSKGSHDFQFDYVLPDHIPSSYIGKYGNVTYTMKVMVIGVRSMDTAISSEPFLVLRRVPLPDGFETPIVLSCEKRKWASCTFGKIFMKVTLDRSGGVPGEDIFLQAEIKNQSRRTVTAMQGALIMRSMFHAQQNQMEFRQIVSKKRDEFDVTHNEGRRWNFVRLTLPPYIPESKLEYCDIIELDYLFQFRVELSGGTEIRLETPFLIGAMPQGLEHPEDQRQGKKINKHWTVRARGMMGIDEPPVDYNEDENEWEIEVVPELRSAETVTPNPLFMQHSYMTNGIQVMPDEYVDNSHEYVTDTSGYVENNTNYIDNSNDYLENTRL